MPWLTDYGRVLNSGGKTFLFLSLIFFCLFLCNFQVLRSQSHRLRSSEVSGNNSLFCKTKVTTTAAQSHLMLTLWNCVTDIGNLKKKKRFTLYFFIPPGSPNAVKSRQAHTASAPSFLHRTCFMSPFFWCHSPGGATSAKLGMEVKKNLYTKSIKATTGHFNSILLGKMLTFENGALISHLCLPGMCRNISFSTKLKNKNFCWWLWTEC